MTDAPTDPSQTPDVPRPASVTDDPIYQAAQSDPLPAPATEIPEMARLVANGALLAGRLPDDAKAIVLGLISTLVYHGTAAAEIAEEAEMACVLLAESAELLALHHLARTPHGVDGDHGLPDALLPHYDPAAPYDDGDVLAERTDWALHAYAELIDEWGEDDDEGDDDAVLESDYDGAFPPTQGRA